MQRSKIATPVALLMVLAGPALAQAPVENNPTRELESQIEAYPGPTELPPEQSDTRIPEDIEHGHDTRAMPPPKPPAPGRSALAPTDGAVAPAEVQRVFGRDASLLPLDTLTVQQITRLQQRLRDMGLYLGTLDGIAGPRTRSALQEATARQFKLSERLLRQGQITSQLAQQMGLSAGADASRSTLGSSPRPSDAQRSDVPPAPAPPTGAPRVPAP